MGAPQPEAIVELDGEQPALVPPGVYELKFTHHATWMMFGKAPKLACWFQIVTLGPYFEQKVPRFYNVKRLIGRPGRNGGFKAGWRCSFVHEYASMFRLPSRLDRISMSEFGRHVILGRLRTVTNGADQKDIPEQLRYSVIEELTGIKHT